MGVNGLYGLSGSGLDIESMVKAGMLSKQNQYDKMYKKEVKNEWLKQGFNEIYTSLNTFKYSTLSDYKMSSKMNAMGAESSDTSIVKATANGDAVAMTHNVEVKSLSQNAYLLTKDGGITRNTTDEKKKSSIYLRDIVFESIEAVDDHGVKKYKINGDADHLVAADATAISFMVQDDTTDSDSLTIDEKNKRTVHYTFGELFESKTLNDLAVDIKNRNTNVSASYDATNDAFSLYNKESGSEATIKLSMGSTISAYSGGDKYAAALFNALNLGQSSGGKMSPEAVKFRSEADAPTATVSLKTTKDGIAYVNAEQKNSGYLKDIVLKGFEPINSGTDEEPVNEYKITKADGTTATVGKDDKAFAFTVTGGSGGVGLQFDVTYGDLEDKTLKQLANDITAKFAQHGGKVTASYDEEKGFSITSEGGALSLKMSDLVGDDHDGLTVALFNNLKLGKSVKDSDPSSAKVFTKNEPVTASLEATTTEVAGTEGEVIIDGRTYKDVKDSRITVSGVTYSLMNVTEGSKVTVSVSQDTTAIIDNVKKFVEDYNKLLDDLVTKYNTKPDGDYEPLSKTQEASMTQEQIDKWTEKAKSGLFYHNEILRDMIYAMRDAVSTPVLSVGSNYNSASAIGITSSNNQGHLQLDEDKLKKALAADPDCVYQIFASDQDTFTSVDPKNRTNAMATDDYNHRGIANRLYFNAVTDGIKNVEDYAGVLADPEDQSTLGLLITQLKTKMDNFKALMDDFQTQLYKKYDALEVMISQMNAQYNTIFGGQQ